MKNFEILILACWFKIRVYKMGSKFLKFKIGYEN